MRDLLIPIRQFVVKIHSRCDLACDHCYVYESADQSWRDRPMAISDEVIAHTAQRIADHAANHQVDEVQVILHGGEPLLIGPVRMRAIVSQLCSVLAGKCHLDLRIHTNGVRLTEQFCELFAEYGVKVGISLDGDKVANDRHRRYADGRSSYDHVIRAIGLLQTERFRPLFAGLLCTIDIANDPIAVYAALRALRPPRVDFLLPHATWEDPPPRRQGADAGYADWLIAIFDRWVADGRPLGIRIFDSILSTLTGGDALTETLGLTPSDLAVVETDGRYEQVDSLKSAFSGAPETGFSVFTDPLDAVARHPGIVARQQGLDGLCETCRSCPVVTSCGGGLYTHRYRSETGFANPSVYCADLLKLITHIESRLPEVLAGQPEVANYAIADGYFCELAAGFGGAAAVAVLKRGQQGLRRALLARVYQASSTALAIPETARQSLHDAWSVLDGIDQRQPDLLNELFGHPYVRAWAVRCLEQLRWPVAAGDGARSMPPRQSGLATDLGHLGAIAAVAAIRTSSSAKVTVPVVDGAVHLPTLGRLVLGSGPEAEAAPRDGRIAVVVVDGGAVDVQVADRSWPLDLTAVEHSSPYWQPVRTMSAPGLRVALEDTDPYRDCHQGSAAARLTESEFARWDRLFRDAWPTIQTEFPALAPALAAGLFAVTPLRAVSGGGEIRGAAARPTFGVVAGTLPADPGGLALLLIQEFQRVKLGALLDLCDLCEPADGRRYHHPWREGPRPLEDLLLDTYAQLAVIEFWRMRERAETGAAAVEAGRSYRRCRDLTRAALTILTGSGSLTALGARFVETMGQTV